MEGKSEQTIYFWPVHDHYFHVMEGKSEQATYFWPVHDHYFHVLSSPWRVDRKTQFLSSMPFCVGMTGFSWSKPLMHLSWQTCTGLEWFSRAAGEFFFLGLQDKYSFEVLAMNEECGIACRWPDLLQLAIWESTTTAVGIFVNRLLVVLFEGHNLCCSEWQGELCLNFVRSGEQGGLSCGFRL